MKNTTSFKRLVAACAVSVVAMLATGMAQADPVICANPLVTGQTHRYQTTGAIDCVWGGGNIGQGGAPGGIPNDKFLAGTGTNDAAYGKTGDNVNGVDMSSTFGLSWSLVGSQNTAGGIPVTTSWLKINDPVDDNNPAIPEANGKTFSWTLTDTQFKTYALGLKDGGDPEWAVFLLSAKSGIADIIAALVSDTNIQGDWSHIALYGTGTPDGGGGGQTEIPEPGTLALVGLALLGGAALRRRKV